MYIKSVSFDSLPNDKIVDLYKFKTFADDNLSVAKMAKFVFDRVETLWEKEKMPVSSIFPFSHNVLKAFFLNPLPDMPILGSSNLATNKDKDVKILTNRDTIF